MNLAKSSNLNNGSIDFKTILLNIIVIFMVLFIFLFISLKINKNKKKNGKETIKLFEFVNHYSSIGGFLSFVGMIVSAIVIIILFLFSIFLNKNNIDTEPTSDFPPVMSIIDETRDNENELDIENPVLSNNSEFETTTPPMIDEITKEPIIQSPPAITEPAIKIYTTIEPVTPDQPPTTIEPEATTENITESPINNKGYLITFSSSFYSELEKNYNTILVDVNKWKPEDLPLYFSNVFLDEGYGDRAYPAYVRILFKTIVNGNIYQPISFKDLEEGAKTTINQEYFNIALNQYSDKQINECYEIFEVVETQEQLYSKIYNCFKFKGIINNNGVPTNIELYCDYYYSVLEVYLRLIEKQNLNQSNEKDGYIIEIVQNCLIEIETLCLEKGITLNNVQSLN